MESVRDKWTDERLDDLNHRVDLGFGEVRDELRDVRKEIRIEFREGHKELLALRADTNARLDGIDARLDGMQRLMAQLAVALTAAILAGFAGICTLIATQI
jgi:tetrahydromethanopterin S-methyltransferase subunit G